MAPARAPPQALPLSLGSAGSLNIKDLIANSSGEDYSIISASMTLSSGSSLYSLLDTPSFATVSSTRPPSSRFTSVAILSTAEPTLPLKIKPPVVVPTPGRVKSMLIEPICVDKWAERTDLRPPPGHKPWEDTVTECDAFPRPPWVPEGSMFHPEALRAILRCRRSTLTLSDATISGGPALLTAVRAPSSDLSSNRINTPSAPLARCDELRSGQKEDFPLKTKDVDREPRMPSIMVSTSTAVVPISLESSQSLAASAPLAVRRGQNLPTPLMLSIPGSHTSTNKETTKSEPDLYPGIPTPFLGSPTTHSPDFDFPAGDAATAMDLNTMCGNLRSLCPPIRTPDVFPPLPPLPPPQTTVPGSASADSVPEIPSFGSDEWGYIEGFLDTKVPDEVPTEADLMTVSMEDTKPLIPIQRASAALSPVTPDGSADWNNSATLAEEASSTTQDTTSPPVSPTSVSNEQRLQRRRTVIIETADSIERRRTRVTLDLSDLGTRKGEPDGDKLIDDHKPIPFETASPTEFTFSPGPFDHSTPNARPASSATMRPPARGILKAQKNVRFSIIPSMHEYEDDDEDRASTLAHQRSPTPPPGGRRNSKLPPSIVNVDVPVDPPSPEKEVPSPKGRVSFPKHPVARSIAKAASAPTSPTTPTAVLVTPKTPPKTKASKSLNPLRARQSMPVVSAVLVSVKDVKDSRKSTLVVKEPTISPKRARAAVSLPPSPPNRKAVPSRRATMDVGAGSPPRSKVVIASPPRPAPPPPPSQKNKIHAAMKSMFRRRS